MQTIVLTDSQEDAIRQLKEFEQSGEASCALMGAAGTGKTTVLNTFLELTSIPEQKICPCAPTHKARKVLEMITGKEAETLHSLLGFRANQDLSKFNYNKPSFEPNAEPRIDRYENGMVICDEASMINMDLLRYLSELCLDYRIRLLFVGDPFQLPPVKESVSRAFIDVKRRLELTEVVRQAQGNPISELLTRLRNDIEEGKKNFSSRFFEYLENNPEAYNAEGEGFTTLKGQGFLDTMTASFKSIDFKTNKNHCRYLCWTNKGVTDMNAYIRKMIYDAPDYVMQGELIMGYTSLFKQTPAGNIPIVVNSEDYTIGDYEEIEIVSHMDEEGDPLKMKVFQTFLKPVYRKPWEPEGQLVQIVHPEYTPMFAARFNHLLYSALNAEPRDRSNAWKAFYRYKDSKLLLQKVSNGAGEDYYKKPKVINKDMDYGYGITVHKSQGSTYDEVFVNVKDILLNKTVEDRNRLLYVACSRASKKLYLYM